MAESDVSPGGTFAWSPPACAGALANIEAIIAEGALANARALAGIALEELGELAERASSRSARCAPSAPGSASSS